jgi:hypothetical protein
MQDTNPIFLNDTPSNARYKILYFWMIVLLCKTKNRIFLDDTPSNARYKILYFWMIVLMLNLKSYIPGLYFFYARQKILYSWMILLLMHGIKSYISG